MAKLVNASTLEQIQREGAQTDATRLGHGRPADVNKLLDICDNISPAIAWPPKQTTICPLGPSAVSPIASAIVRFRDEFFAYCGGEPVEITVPIAGKAYIAAPSTVGATP